MDKFGGLSHRIFARPRFGGATHDMIKDHDFDSARDFFEQLFNLRVIYGPDFGVVVKVDYLGVMTSQREALCIQGELVEDQSCIMNGDGFGIVTSGGLRHAR